MCGIVGDFGAQRIEGYEVRKHDLSRTATVCLYYASAAGTFWIPFFGYLDRIFGNVGLWTVVAKTVATNAFAMPCFDIPAFHLCALGPRIGLDAAVERLRAGYRDALAAAWLVWIPTSVAVFHALPTHYRLPAMYAVCIAESRSPDLWLKARRVSVAAASR